MAKNPMSNKYVFGIKGLDMMFERLYKKHGSTMNRMFKGRDLSPDDAMGILSFIDRNSDMSYVELKNKLIPPKKTITAYGRQSSQRSHCTRKQGLVMALDDDDKARAKFNKDFRKITAAEVKLLTDKQRAVYGEIKKNQNIAAVPKEGFNQLMAGKPTFRLGSLN